MGIDIIEILLLWRYMNRFDEFVMVSYDFVAQKFSPILVLYNELS